MIHAWVLVLAVAPLIASNLYGLKQIEKLRNALNVKSILVGEPRALVGQITMLTPGDNIRITTKDGAPLFDISVSDATFITVKACS